ncbi:MAG: hypothetical protein HS107_04235 [Thermoflexaceae bacterium]|nr:hypothetical protein [Thermoflexaceae bacterium]
MSRYRFIAAEKAAVRNVAKACALLKVSRSGNPSPSMIAPVGHREPDAR